MMSNQLFHTPIKNSAAQIRLVCFAYAGGSSALFMPWLKYLPEHIELVLCQLPGRGARLCDQPYDGMEPLIRDLTHALQGYNDKPMVFFGHSMGAKVAYELCCALREKKLPLPVNLIASAAAAPFHSRRRLPIHDLPDAEFIAAIGKLNGTPAPALNNPELMALFLPALRADFKVVETYINTSREVLNTRLTLMGGVLDETVSPSELADWNKLFTGTTAIRWFQGDHFFINSKSFAVLQHVNKVLNDELLLLQNRPVFRELAHHY
ncbi:MAG TPA: alpha/beta fold hydrolase [Cellvibrio sp.]